MHIFHYARRSRFHRWPNDTKNEWSSKSVVHKSVVDMNDFASLHIRCISERKCLNGQIIPFLTFLFRKMEVKLSFNTILGWFLVATFQDLLRQFIGLFWVQCIRPILALIISIFISFQTCISTHCWPILGPLQIPCLFAYTLHFETNT